MSIPIQVTFDAADPARLAEFWAEALGYILQPPPSGYASWEEFAGATGLPEERRGDLAAVVDPDGVGPRLLFQRVPEGKVVKNRVHLDVNAGAGYGDDTAQRVSAVNAHVARLLELGASQLETVDRHGEYWVVMQDPEGNEFCVQ